MTAPDPRQIAELFEYWSYPGPRSSNRIEAFTAWLNPR